MLREYLRKITDTNKRGEIIPLKESHRRKIKLSHCGIFLILLVSLTGFLFATWDMYQFRSRLHDVIDNGRWEKTLADHHLYDDNLIVFFGDSQIALWSMSTSFGTLPIVNRGISGGWVLEAVNRFDYDVMAKKPHVLVLLIGINDLADGQSIDAIITNIEGMVKKASDKNIKVILCSLLPVAGEEIKYHAPKDIILLNNKLLILAQQYKADYVDFHSQLIDENGLFRSDFTKDGLHPNKSGYLRMSHIIFPYLCNNL
jgi:lysophospholipase L1-like esterase